MDQYIALVWEKISIIESYITWNVPIRSVYPYIPCEAAKTIQVCEDMLYKAENYLPDGFGTLRDLLPRSITYCILLSITRFVLALLIFRVSN